MTSALVTVSGAGVVRQLESHVGDDLRGDITSGRTSILVALGAAERRERTRVAEAHVLGRQAPVVQAARRLGIRVISRYTTAANGLLVHGTSSQLARLAGHPDVVRIEPSVRMRPSAAGDAPAVVAEALVPALDYDGEGAVIAIVDSGIDYTHAAFAGPGSPAAHVAASAAAEIITDTWEGELLYPTSKVIGGYDFVGPNYTAPPYCPPAAEAAGRCTSTPRPDPDPLDQMGHGTSVAGVAAGLETAQLAHGVAPGAKLVALKVYGPPAQGIPVDEEVDVVLDAIEWCTRVNLTMSVPGEHPDYIHVINLSMGEPYAQGSRLFEEAVRGATKTGLTLVASAGNAGAVPFVLGAPGATPGIVSVAGAFMGGDSEEPARIWPGSARGPGKNGALKPEIAAPAVGVRSAAIGTGVGGSSASGTSMSSPFVAGAAALVHQRSLMEGAPLWGLDRAALLINYARHDVVVERGSETALAAVARQGSGLLDAAESTSGQLLVRSGDLAGVNLGAMSLYETLRVEKPLHVRNLSDEVVGFRVEPVFRHPQAEESGISVSVPQIPLVLPSRAEMEVPVTFRIAPADLPPWTALGLPYVGERALDELELDGWLNLVGPSATTSAPRPGSLRASAPASPHVPFYALARRASRIHSLGFAPGGSGSAWELKLANASPYEGPAELYVIAEGGERGDPDEPEVVGELDVRRVGVRFRELDDSPSIEFGIVTYGVAPVPQVTSYEVYVAIDGDEIPDYRIRTGTEYYLSGSGSDQRMAVALARRDGATGMYIDEAIVGDVPTDLYTRIARFGVPLDALGLEEPHAVSFYVVHRGLTEDWLRSPNVDVVPDGATDDGGPRLRFDPGELAYELDPCSADLAGGDVATLTLGSLPGSWQAGILALFPANQFEWRDAQAAVLQRGSGRQPVPGPQPIYLPLNLHTHRIYKIPPANEMVRQAIDELGRVERLRMTYDLNDSVDPSKSANRDYTFDGLKGTRLVASWRAGPRRGERDEFIRWGDKGYFMPHGGDWMCWHVDAHMLLWPEMVERLRREFPPRGWEYRDPPEGRYANRDVWKLYRAATATNGESFMSVDMELGLPLLLSRVEGGPRNHIYVPRDFNDPTATTGKPVPNCP